MQTMNSTKISNDTLEILKNFSSINSNILVRVGNKLTTISPVKNVMAEAEVSETFDQEFGIWDLNKFLGTVSLFDSPEFTFNENSVDITSQSNSSSVQYYYSEPSLLTTVNKTINMPECVVECNITQANFNDVLKAASVLQVNDIAIRSNGSDIELLATDKKDSTSNSYSVVIGDNPTGATFMFYFKAENLKVLPGDYRVGITEKVVSQFVHTKRPLTYWVALESDSTYSA
jgi:hypothetical protein